MVDKTLKDVYESDPLALASAYGVDVVDPEETVEAAKDAAQFTWESLPGVGTYYTVEDIKNELRLEKPNYLKIGALAGTEVIGLVPGLGGAAKNMIRKGADIAKGTDNVIDATSSIPKVSKNARVDLRRIDPESFDFSALNLTDAEIERYADVYKRFGDRKRTEAALNAVEAEIERRTPLIEKTLKDALDTNKGTVTLEDYKNAVKATESYDSVRDAAKDIADQQQTLNKMGVSIYDDMVFDDAVNSAFESAAFDGATSNLDLLDELLSAGYHRELVDYAVTEDAIRKSYNKFMANKGITPQMSNDKYDMRMAALDEIDDVKEWQQAAKKEIETGRVVDPQIKTPELEESTRLLLDNKITREEHLANVDKFKPVNAWDALPREPSNKAVVYSLKDDQRLNGFFVLDNAAEMGVNQSSLKVGDLFNGRLDIPAYNSYDTWIVTGSSKNAEKGKHYLKAVHYRSSEDAPVKFIASTKTSEKIGAGEMNKTPYATVQGFIEDLDADAIRAKAAEYLNDPEWTQIGFDPRRQGGFYVRAGENKHVPIREASEVIQIGPLLLAKNAKLDIEYSGYNEGGAVMDEQMKAVFKSSRTGYAAGGTVDLDTVPDNTVGVDPVSGNEVPLGSSPEEVRDDIPAQLSEGEYVVPADVVRYYGVKYFEDLRAQAKFGYQDMQENGRIGGEPVGMEMGGDELPFDISELQVVDEPVQMNEGGMPVAYGGTMYGGSGVEYIEYTDGTRTMLIPFFNGVPMAIIPEGFYPGSPKTAAEKAAEVQTSDDDGDPPDTEMPDPIDYANLTTDELAEMVEQQTTLGMDDGIQALLTGLNPLAGLFMKGAMVHQAKLTKRELERRVESEDISDEERARIQSLIEVTEQPSFMQGILGKIKGAFDKEETKEPEIPPIDKQSVTDAVTEAMMYDPTAKSVLEESTITTSELTPVVTPTNKAGEMPEPYRPVIEGPNVTAMRKKYLGDENKQPDVDFADPTMVPEDPNANETVNMRMRRAGERAGDYVTSKTKARMIRREAEKRGKSIAEIGRAIAPTKDDDDPTDTGGKGNVGLGSGAGGMKKGGLASKKKKKNN
jgi:hypothetical protein